MDITPEGISLYSGSAAAAKPQERCFALKSAKPSPACADSLVYPDGGGGKGGGRTA
jgi:hypothetical protein